MCDRDGAAGKAGATYGASCVPGLLRYLNADSAPEDIVAGVQASGQIDPDMPKELEAGTL